QDLPVLSLQQSAQSSHLLQYIFYEWHYTIIEVYLDNCNQFQLSDNTESKQAQALSKSFYSSHSHLQQLMSTSCAQSVLIYSQRASQSSHSMPNPAEQKNQSED